MEDEKKSPAEALSLIIQILNMLEETDRARVLQSVSHFFAYNSDIHSATTTVAHQGRPSFSKDYSPTPKEFLLQKQPKTDVERVACLAFYLAHYRDNPHFKTLDLAKLNTEAAQPKFSNTAYAATNAVNTGYLVPATKGQRQLSAAGEQFVQALPDRDAAKRAMANARQRRFHSKTRGSKLDSA